MVLGYPHKAGGQKYLCIEVTFESLKWWKWGSHVKFWGIAINLIPHYKELITAEYHLSGVSQKQWLKIQCSADQTPREEKAKPTTVLEELTIGEKREGYKRIDDFTNNISIITWYQLLYFQRRVNGFRLPCYEIFLNMKWNKWDLNIVLRKYKVSVQFYLGSTA